jgi:hypothetical protein
MSIQTAVASEYTHMVLLETEKGKTTKVSVGVKEVCIHDSTDYFNSLSYSSVLKFVGHSCEHCPSKF